MWLTCLKSGVAVVLVTLTGTAEPPRAAKQPNLYRQAEAFHHYTAGMYLYEEKNNKAALVAHTKAVEADPTLSWAFYRRGMLYALAGENAKAVADFKRMTDLDADIIFAHYNLACLYALEKKVPEALASLETALARGYRKFDKLAKDPDLDNLRQEKKFDALIARYKKLVATEKRTRSQVFQTGSTEERFAVLREEIDKSSKETLRLALLALHDPVPEMRVLGVQLLATSKEPKAKEQLVKGLYDANGYVNKAAGNALIALGKDAEKLVLPVLRTKDDHATFYAVQVLGRVGGKASAGKIVPLLAHSDSHIRAAAAGALTRLKAVDALPQLEKQAGKK